MTLLRTGRYLNKDIILDTKIMERASIKDLNI